MRTRTLVIALVVAVSLAGATAVPARAHTSRRYVATYVPGTSVGCAARVMLDWYAGAVVDPSPAPCVGAVSAVPVSHIDRNVHVRIEDASGARIGGELRFFDQKGAPLVVRDRDGTALPFCGGTAAAVPVGAASLFIGLHGDACGDAGGVATTGRLVADFTCSGCQYAGTDPS